MREDAKKVIEAVRTKEELDILKRALMRLEQALYKSGMTGAEEVLKKDLPADLAKIMRGILFSQPYEGNRGEIGGFIVKVKEEISGIRVLGLDLAFFPPEKAVDAISGWLQREVGAGIVLDIGINRAILGGARLTFAGKYKDSTLERLVGSALEEEKENILAMVRPVLDRIKKQE